MLKQSTLVAAAKLYHIDPILLTALCQVESGGCGFLADGRVKILFERHVFWKQLQRRGIDPRPLARALPGECGPDWNPRRFPYGGVDEQWWRVARIDHWAMQHAPAQRGSIMKAAWESCSYGLFQLLGRNYQSAGFPEITSFMDAQAQDEEVQLGTILHWMQNNGTLALLRERKFTQFAGRYNGSRQRDGYARKLWQQYHYAARLSWQYVRETMKQKLRRN